MTKAQKPLATKLNPSGSLSSLLSQLTMVTKQYVEFLSSEGLPEPSFGAEYGLQPQSVFVMPQDLIDIRDAAIKATDDLRSLLMGPLEIVLSAPSDQYLLLALQYIYRYRLASFIPTSECLDFATVSKKANVPVADLRRLMRVAISRHVFCEPQPGSVSHTAASLLLIDNPLLEGWILTFAEQLWPALSHVVDATAAWPGSEEPNECGYSLGHRTTENVFDLLKKDEKKQQHFINSMSFSPSSPSYSISHLLANHDFGAIGAGMLVDVGGSHGQVSMAIAQRWPEIKCVVQDLPDVIEGLHEEIPQELEGRVTGMGHDFFTTNPVKGADIYFFRWILHDCDMDISMKALNNALERDAEQWKSLFATADPRFNLKEIKTMRRTALAIIIAEWTGVQEC
ncbi:MAG: hypothetical protein M1822_004433 [Bathelium mastoideum]|nr:MAG: hypothetical protein M1822_004433 [Bathelium mastoideum]